MFFLVLICVSGCGKQGEIISGKVSFTDGTPLETGSVYFESDKNSFFGPILAGGAYTVSKGNGRLLPGRYKVRLGGTSLTEEVMRGEEVIDFKRTELVKKKYCSAETSGLEFNVKPDAPRTYDIVVERP